MAIKMIDDSILQDIAESIQAKDGLGKMTPGQMPGRIDDLNGGGGDVPNPDDSLLLVDWDGTLLYSYTYEDAQLISEFPDPPVHEGLTFQGWNWAEVIAKTWLQTHRGAQLKVGATYMPTDGQDHNYWRSPRLSEPTLIYKQNRSTTTIPDRAFSEYLSLCAISIPNGVTSIGAYAFQSCFSLKAANLPNTLTSTGNGAFSNCYGLTSLSLPRNLTTISEATYYHCQTLPTVSLPDSVTQISTQAFEFCYSLYEIILSRNLTTIGEYAFAYCKSLPKIDIPARVTLIGSYAFQNCTSLVDVVIRGTPALDGSVVFAGNPSNQRFYVHRSDLSWFETATNWSAIYGEGKIVAAADYIEYLQSIGTDTADFEEE